MKRFFLFLITLLLLTSCSPDPAQVSQTVGVGREPVTEEETVTEELSEGVEDTAQTGSDPAENSGKLWELVGGKYTYNFPERDDSGLSDLSDLAAVQYVPFPDAGEDGDWYFGVTQRDSVTGNVTYVWERDQSTLDILDKYDTIYRGDETRNVCYLTFDCGYETGTMTSILDTLKEKNVPATFFVNGHYVESAQDMIRRMLDEGHIVANHCVNHYALTTVDADTFIEEVQGLEDLFYTYFPDADPMIYFRPPSGNTNEWVLKLADKMGYTTVLWSWAYADYYDDAQPPVDETLEKVKLGLHPGAIYLLHPESTTNTAMLGTMIDWIRSVGYDILPICDIGME